MKTLRVFFIFAFMVGVLVNCQREEVKQQKAKEEIEQYGNQRKKFHIYHATWDRWGRTSRNCSGFGLCYYTDCWFCCTENGYVVDCRFSKIIPRSGIIYVDTVLKEGYMKITLDTTDFQQKEAWEHRIPLILDEDIEGSNFILKKGIYSWQKNIGTFGGYYVDVSVK